MVSDDIVYHHQTSRKAELPALQLCNSKGTLLDEVGQMLLPAGNEVPVSAAAALHCSSFSGISRVCQVWTPTLHAPWRGARLSRSAARSHICGLVFWQFCNLTSHYFCWAEVLLPFKEETPQEKEQGIHFPMNSLFLSMTRWTCCLFLPVDTHTEPSVSGHFGSIATRDGSATYPGSSALWQYYLEQVRHWQGRGKSGQVLEWGLWEEFITLSSW